MLCHPYLYKENSCNAYGVIYFSMKNIWLLPLFKEGIASLQLAAQYHYYSYIDQIFAANFWRVLATEFPNLKLYNM